LLIGLFSPEPVGEDENELGSGNGMLRDR